jgi:hypothetical protein
MAQFNVANNSYLNSSKTLFEVVQIADQYGALVGAANPSGMAVDAFGRARVSQPVTLFDSFHRYNLNERWVSSNTANTDVTFDANASTVSLNVDEQNGSKVIRETKRVFVYQPGKSLQILNTFVMNEPKANLVQKVGYYNDENGIFFQLSGNTATFVLRSNTTGSIVNSVATQDNWSIDKLDGTGPSKITLDLTKAQISFFDIEWLGVGSVRCGFIIDGKYIHCHTFNHANIFDSVYMTTAMLPLRYEIENLGATDSSSTLKQICSAVISEGGYEPRGEPKSFGLNLNDQRTLSTLSTDFPVVSLRLNPDFIDDGVIIREASVFGISTAVYKIAFVRDATISGAVWANVSSTSSVQYNSNSTATMSGGTIVYQDYFASTNQSSGQINIGPDLFKYQLERNGLTDTPFVFTLAVQANSNNANVVASLSWEEVS